MIASCSYPVRTDVVVVGGTASGVCAAVQSARMDVGTVLVEETPWLGGMLTSAGVSCVDGNYNIRSGIFAEFCDSLALRYGGYDSLKTGWVSNICFEPHIGAEVFDHIAAGCRKLDVLKNTSVQAVERMRRGWKLTLATADGKTRALRAKVVIDATELGDIASQCGVRYRLGMDSAEDTGESIAPAKANGVVQDMTYVAVLKDYGPDADMTIERPEGYDARNYANAAVCPLNTESDKDQALWPAEEMIEYGALPGGKYMINWPIDGNDFYANIVDASDAVRQTVTDSAKNFTLGFVYFIQTELGMKNLGLADDEFPTADRLPFYPYYRESRRICGEAFFTVDAAARPYDFPEPYYRTGIAVGDYAVDHHHYRHPDWKSLPELHFYPIPSYTLPLGTLLPENTDDLIVAEKSVSVSNLINGTTRLQPVVMQTGQAAGANAALAVKSGVSVKEVPVRDVQEAILESGGRLMPLLDLPADDRHFAALQRIAATGILRCEGRNEGWANQMWFRAQDPLLGEELHASDYYGNVFVFPDGQVTAGALLEKIAKIQRGGVACVEDVASLSDRWPSLGLGKYEAGRPLTRLEAAVAIDAYLDPFDSFDVDYHGNIIGRNSILKVDPLIGSGGHGHVFVGANVPHGMAAAGPNNISTGWDWCSGYHDSDRTVAGFAQNHLSGTGIADLGEILFMPYTGVPKFGKGTGHGDGYALTFDKKNEKAAPGYYRIELPQIGVNVELTASERVAFHRYSVTAGQEFGLILDLESAPISIMSRRGCLSSGYCQADSSLLTGFRISDEWADSLAVWFAAEFDRPFTLVEHGCGKAALDFGRVSGVNARVALSYTSEAAAVENLEAESLRSFDEALLTAERKWTEELSSISFKGLDSRTDSIFYTALYHTAFAPQLFSDAGAPREDWTIFSTWDTYRAVHQLYSIIDPDAGKYVNSLIDLAHRTGRLPVWSLCGLETDCMVGVHSVPVIADAALKSLPGVDRKEALDVIAALSRQPVPGMEYIDSLGFIPADSVNWSVSRALEYCIDDDAVYRLAEKLGETRLADYYRSRAGLYREYFDSETGFMRGRLADGSWREPFDPAFSLHEFADYVEGNAWQYTWLVPHDIPGLISLFGSEEAFTERLDSLFTTSSQLNEGASADITGMIGQYAHGNEPSHHIAYIYPYVGEPWKTAEKVRKICREFYTTSPDGLIGNEDCGQMSAWYIFSALGFYPLHPTSGDFVFGSPLCREAVIRTAAGTEFTVKALNNTETNIYIQKITLNGRPYEKPWISYGDIMKGGELVFEMGDKPNKYYVQNF